MILITQQFVALLNVGNRPQAVDDLEMQGIIYGQDDSHRGGSSMEAIEKKSDIEMEPKQLALAETFEITEDTLRMIDA